MSGRSWRADAVERLRDVHAGVELGMVGERLRHAVQRVDLGQEPCERAAVAQHREHARRLRLHQAARELLPDALGSELRELVRGDQRAHQRLGLRRDAEAEARGEARDAQHAQRILGEGRGDVAQHAGGQVRGAAEADRSARRPARAPSR